MRSDTPKRTVACEGYMLRQKNSKKQGTEIKYCTLTMASPKERTRCHVYERKGIKLSKQERSDGLKQSLGNE